jgi:uncharacterized membrane protein YobD (UPF0266 family)
MYTVFWAKPVLPINQTVLAYNTNYRALNGSDHPHNVSKDTTFISVNVAYEKHYTFEIRVVTPAGISDMVTETWFSHAGITYTCIASLKFVLAIFPNYPRKPSLLVVGEKYYFRLIFMYFPIHLAPLELLNKTNDGCIVKLVKPREEQKMR